MHVSEKKEFLMMAKMRQGVPVTLMAMLLSVGSQLAQAQDTVYIGAPEHSDAVTVGQPRQDSGTEPDETLTERWLRIQAGGQAASTHPQQASPQERELANQRLLDSYRHSIPEFFEQDEGGEIAR